MENLMQVHGITGIPKGNHLLIIHSSPAPVKINPSLGSKFDAASAQILVESTLHMLQKLKALRVPLVSGFTRSCSSICVIGRSACGHVSVLGALSPEEWCGKTKSRHAMHKREDAPGMGGQEGTTEQRKTSPLYKLQVNRRMAKFTNSR